MNKKNLLLGKQPSKIRELFEYGKKLKITVGEKNVFDFSIGNPSLHAPQFVDETLTRLISENETNKLHSYTSNAGDLGVRSKIAENLNKEFGVNFRGEHIFMTCGAAASLAICFNAILEEGDEVLVTAPYFPEYRIYVEECAKGKLVLVNPNTKDFTPDLEDLKSKINEKTVAVLIDSPNNPTGACYSEEVIKQIAEILKEKEKEYNKVIYFVSDEPYRELMFEDEPYPFISKYYKDSIICYSYSKCYSIPGDRIGYVAVNEECQDVEDLFYAISGASRELGFVCAPSIFQFLIGEVDGMKADLSPYKVNRDIFYNGLTKIGYEVIYPKGAFYLFMKALEEDANAFADKAKELGLIMVPSDSFGYKGYVRLAYCVSQDTIERALSKFETLFQQYKAIRGN